MSRVRLGDLARLSTLPFKLAMLLAMHYPHEESTWRELPSLMKQARVCRRIEADMPPSANPAILRQEATQQMMREVAEVLSIEEQRRLGEMLQVASDRLAIRRKAAPIASPATRGSSAIHLLELPVASGVGAPW